MKYPLKLNINNCVGEENFKFFVLLLLYCFLSALFSMYIHISYYTGYYPEVEENPIYNQSIIIKFTFFVTIIFFLFDTCILLVAHLNILLNRTTLEWYDIRKEEQSGKIFINYLRNARSQDYPNNLRVICESDNLCLSLWPLRQQILFRETENLLPL
ncbi:hypothetical protein A3Q56_04853 [Intoshia linei]|uniref:Palmitoyltransferase n=1 Tax=Intoshia linei TaxID=1819745 RepID=A0A177B103_9BILA|nr:hypothetical protein A3Q56_04853 [Intoshia linei]